MHTKVQGLNCFKSGCRRTKFNKLKFKNKMVTFIKFQGPKFFLNQNINTKQKNLFITWANRMLSLGKKENRMLSQAFGS